MRLRSASRTERVGHPTRWRLLLLTARLVRARRIAVLIAMAFIGVAWLHGYRQPGELAVLFGLVLLPLGCAVVPAMTVPSWRSGLRGLAVREVDPLTLSRGLTLINLAIVALAAMGIAFLLWFSGLDGVRVLRWGLVWMVVGALLVSANTVLVARWGSAAMLLLTLGGVVAAVLVGGNDGLRSLSIWIPWSWGAGAASEQSPLVLPLAVILGAVASWAAVKTLAAERDKFL